MRIVVALGGNALLHRGERPDAAPQLTHVREAAAALAPLAHDHELVICHGNGPQIGLLALESEVDRSLARAYPLDALVAQTQGMIGYWLSQGLTNAGVIKPVLAISTQVLVDPLDPGFARPTKFVGAVYERDQAEQLAADRGWTIGRDGAHWRRTVASPEPVEVVEKGVVQELLGLGAVVICGGGGGVPVALDAAGQLRGIEAVVDKDLTAALLAVALNADHLLVLTDVEAVMEDFGTPAAAPLRVLTVDQVHSGQFPAGSMGPKVEACARFVRATGRPATIGSLADASRLLSGGAGTVVLPPSTPTAPVAAFAPLDRTRAVEHASIVDAARHAPSIHNTQPWRFTSGSAGLDLWADRTRALPVLDPDARQLHLSCGAALLHARVAARAMELDVTVALLPDPAQPDHLARLHLTAGRPATTDELQLAGAIGERHTYRAAFTDRPLPAGLVDALRLVTEREGAVLRPVMRQEDLIELEVLLDRADRSEVVDLGYLDELAQWVHRDDASDQPRQDGIPEGLLPDDVQHGSSLRLRDFRPGTRAAARDVEVHAEHPHVTVVVTDGDSLDSWLRAGQALAAVLLHATVAGVAAQPLGQVTDTISSRLALGRALGMLGTPQLALRLGYPSEPGSAGEHVTSPRRSVEDLLGRTPA